MGRCALISKRQHMIATHNGESKHAEGDVSIRLSQASDAPAIARIHTDSWRRHYRGMYSDRFLDGDLYADRLSVWTERLTQAAPDHFTLVAEHHGLPVGFAHVALAADPTWGALVENLHVERSMQRTGVGSVLLDRAASIIAERQPGSGIFLWVLEQNEAAIAFYVARQGTLRDREQSSAPGKDPRNLHGRPMRIRVTWSHPELLSPARDLGAD